MARSRYIAGFVLVDGDQLLRQFSLPAPSEPEAVQLDELYHRALDLMSEHAPEVVVIRGYEMNAGTAVAKRIGAHAEGVILAAAGRSNLPVVVVSGAQLRGSQTTEAALNRLCGGLTPQPEGIEVRNAAAGVRAAPLTGTSA